MEKPVERAGNAIASAADSASKTASQAKEAVTGAAPQAVKEVQQVVESFDLRIFQHLSQLVAHGRELLDESKDKVEGVADAAAQDAIAIKHDVRNLYRAVRGLLLQVLSSPEFRNSILESVDVLRDILTYGLNLAKRTVDEKLSDAGSEEDGSEPEAGAKSGTKRKGRGGGKKKGGKKKKATAADEEAGPGKKAVDEVKARAEQVISGQTYVPLTDDEKTKLRERVFALVRTVAQSDAHRRALSASLSILSHLKHMAQIVAKESASAVLQPSSASMRLWDDTKQLVHDLAPQANVEEFGSELLRLVRSVGKEPRLAELFAGWGRWITETAAKPELLTQAATQAKFGELLEGGRKLVHELYSTGSEAVESFQRWVGVARTLISVLSGSALVSKLPAAVGRLIMGLLSGSSVGASEFLSSVRNTISKLLATQLSSVPLPPLEGTTEHLQYRIEGMRLATQNLLPDSVLVKADSTLLVDVPAGAAEQAKTNVSIVVRNIKTELTDVKFWFKRTGLINVEDEGTAVIALRGEGAAVQLDMRINANRIPILEPVMVRCVLDDLHIHIVDARHASLLNLITSIWSGTLKRMLEERIENQIEGTINDLITKIVDLL